MERVRPQIFQAIESRDIPRLKALISSGENVNYKDENGVTPLIYATVHDDVEAMALLMDAGAKVNARDKRKVTALSWGAVYGHVEPIKLLLRNKKTMLGIRDDDGDDALMHADMLRRFDAFIILNEAASRKKALRSRS